MLNSLTSNLNVLFLGADGRQLLMAAVFTINHSDSCQAGALFFPVETLLGSGTGSSHTLEEIFREDGALTLKQALAEQLHINLSYFIRIDRAVLAGVKNFLDPIVVNGRTVELENLFSMDMTPEDEQILGQLLGNLTRPSVYFWHLPRLVLNFRRYLETDFVVSPQNLLLHYRIARGVDTSAIPKVIAAGLPGRVKGRKVWLVSPSVWEEGIYRLTGLPGGAKEKGAG